MWGWEWAGRWYFLYLLNTLSLLCILLVLEVGHSCHFHTKIWNKGAYLEIRLKFYLQFLYFFWNFQSFLGTPIVRNYCGNELATKTKTSRGMQVMTGNELKYPPPQKTFVVQMACQNCLPFLLVDSNSNCSYKKFWRWFHITCFCLIWPF